ncbi:MAG: hypothetical protein ACE15F_12500 [bacterium]
MLATPVSAPVQRGRSFRYFDSVCPAEEEMVFLCLHGEKAR